MSYSRCFLKGEMNVLIGIKNGKPNNDDQCFINEESGMILRVHTEERLINDVWEPMRGIEVFHASKMTGSMQTIGLFLSDKTFSFDDIKEICKPKAIIEHIKEIQKDIPIEKIEKVVKKRRIATKKVRRGKKK